MSSAFIVVCTLIGKIQVKIDENLRFEDYNFNIGVENYENVF